MLLVINGDPVHVPDEIGTVNDLLHHFGLEDKVAIVEQNHNILQKDDHSQAPVKENDRFEIVHFVGGG